MANPEQLEILKQGVEYWNKWRDENPNVLIDLHESDLVSTDLSGANLRQAILTKSSLLSANFSEANLEEANLAEADLQYSKFNRANLTSANLTGTTLFEADLSEATLIKANFGQAKSVQYANFSGADMREVNLYDHELLYVNMVNANLQGAILRKVRGARLSGANLENANLVLADLIHTDLSGATLINAHLRGATLYGTNLSGANLQGADLTAASLSNQVNLEKADLRNCRVYGLSAWDVLVDEETKQDNLIITKEDEPVITVDNINVAQFIYLILKNEKLRDVIDTLTSKSVLILGRFSLPERKSILDAIKHKLKEFDLLPIVFDFDRPTDKDFTETIKTLAGLTYFVIADVTNPKSSPLELQATVPDYQIPFVPIIQAGESPFAMMVDLQKKYNWVLNTISYDSEETLVEALKPLIIDPAMKKRQELRMIKAQEPEIISAKEFLTKGKA